MKIRIVCGGGFLVAVSSPAVRKYGRKCPKSKRPERGGRALLVGGEKRNPPLSIKLGFQRENAACIKIEVVSMIYALRIENSSLGGVPLPPLFSGTAGVYGPLVV